MELTVKELQEVQPCLSSYIRLYTFVQTCIQISSEYSKERVIKEVNWLNEELLATELIGVWMNLQPLACHGKQHG